MAELAAGAIRPQHPTSAGGQTQYTSSGDLPRAVEVANLEAGRQAAMPIAPLSSETIEQLGLKKNVPITYRASALEVPQGHQVFRLGLPHKMPPGKSYYGGIAYGPHASFDEIPDELAEALKVHHRYKPQMLPAFAVDNRIWSPALAVAPNQNRQEHLAHIEGAHVMALYENEKLVEYRVVSDKYPAMALLYYQSEDPQTGEKNHFVGWMGPFHGKEGMANCAKKLDETFGRHVAAGCSLAPKSFPQSPFRFEHGVAGYSPERFHKPQLMVLTRSEENEDSGDPCTWIAIDDTEHVASMMNVMLYEPADGGPAYVRLYEHGYEVISPVIFDRIVAELERIQETGHIDPSLRRRINDPEAELARVLDKLRAMKPVMRQWVSNGTNG